MSKSIFSTWHGILGGGGSDLLAAFGGGSQAHSPSRLQSQGVHALKETVHEFFKLHRFCWVCDTWYRIAFFVEFVVHKTVSLIYTVSAGWAVATC